MKEHLAEAEIHLSFMLPQNTLCCGQAKVFENYVFTVGFQKKECSASLKIQPGLP